MILEIVLFSRLLRPGGVINGFEVPFPEGALEREAMVLFNTWGYDWQVHGFWNQDLNIINIFLFSGL